MNQWLSSVHLGNIDYVLREYLPHPNRQDAQVCYQWIVDTTSGTAITDPVQGLYLCALLGWLVRHDHAFQGPQPPYPQQTKHAFDTLLWYLVKCSRARFKISGYLCSLLKDVSHILVMSSSRPDWLTFAAHFYPFCSKQFLLEQSSRIPPAQYDSREKYLELLNLLLPNVEKFNTRNEYILRGVLKKVFQASPDENLLWELCEDERMWRIFRNEEERRKFFTECYLDRLSSSENDGEILRKILIIPEKFRSLKWAQIYDFLLNFIAKTHEDKDDEDIKAFISIVLSLHLQKEQVYKILKLLSESSSTPYQIIVLHFLRENKFQRKWDCMNFKDKLEIGKSWLMTRIQNERTVATAYQTLDELALCPLVQKHQGFKRELLDFLRMWLFDNMDHSSIIAEVGKNNNVGDLPSDVQKSILNLVRAILQNDLNLINKQEILNEILNSRYIIPIKHLPFYVHVHWNFAKCNVGIL
jgi:hypothetical protein